MIEITKRYQGQICYEQNKENKDKNRTAHVHIVKRGRMRMYAYLSVEMIYFD